MATSVGMKAHKKQSSLSGESTVSASERQLEYALLSLENTCLRILESRFARDRQDTEGRYWQQSFKNIVTPVSLALAEYKGPRRFHYHYRHRHDDQSVLRPVLEPSPLDMLAQVCKDALRQSQARLVGIQDGTIIDTRNSLEIALQGFISRHREYKKRLS